MEKEGKSQIEQTLTLAPPSLNLTHDQYLFITTKLPKGLSLVPLNTKNTRRDQREPKLEKNKLSDKEPPQSQQTINQQEPENVVGKRQRIKKVPHQPDEDNSLHESDPELKACVKILLALKKHPSAWPFLVPVDPHLLKIPDYFTIIKEPMDLSTVEKNLRNKQYQTPTQFHADVNKIFTNSYRYNGKHTQVYKETVELQKAYIKLKSDVEEAKHKSHRDREASVAKENPYYGYHQYSHNHHKEGRDSASHGVSADVLARLSAVNAKIAQASPTKVSKKKKKTFQQQPPMSIVDRKQLGVNLKRLPKDQLRGVWDILYPDAKPGAEFEFDVTTLDNNKARELERYVNQRLVSLYEGLNAQVTTVQQNLTSSGTAEAAPARAVTSMQIQQAAHSDNRSRSSSSFEIDSESDN